MGTHSSSPQTNMIQECVAPVVTTPWWKIVLILFGIFLSIPVGAITLKFIVQATYKILDKLDSW